MNKIKKDSNNLKKPNTDLPALDVELAEHCNLRCKGCGHFAMLNTPKFADLSDFEKLKKLISVYDYIEIFYKDGYKKLTAKLISFQFQNYTTLCSTNSS